ncbi:hypothetical protein KKG65_02160 [Patescibacteria group bacterium]|nr:hypothetical protein [Patescibacteria group bacterium]
MISFEYKGKSYLVSDEAYDLNRIVLPNGTLLEAGIWYESLPPQVGRLTPVEHLFKNLEPTVIAKQMNAALAQEGRRLLFEEFRFLQPGDKVYYVAGLGSHHVECNAVVVSESSASVMIRITEILLIRSEVDDLSVGDEIAAGAGELCRLQ